MSAMNETAWKAFLNEGSPIADPIDGLTAVAASWPEDDLAPRVDEYEYADESQGSVVHMSKFSIAIAMSVCCFIGFFGNTMSTLIFLHAHMRSPINTLLAFVSIIDLSLLVLIIPVLILPGLNMVLKSHFLGSLYIGSILYIYPIGVMSRTASMWTYVLVGVERYVAVCQPLKRYRLLSNRQAKHALLGIVVVSVLYNICRFFEYRWNSETQQLEPFLHADHFYFFFYYTALHLITHFLLPITVILILHASIVLKLKHAHNRRSSLRYANGACNMQRRLKSTTFMIVVATGVFVACNILSFLVNLWETIDPSGLEDERWSTFVHVMTDSANLLLALHSACSFLIYMKFCRQYRRLFRRLIGFENRPRLVHSAVLLKRRRRWKALRRMLHALQLRQMADRSSADVVVTSFHSGLSSDRGRLAWDETVQCETA